MNRVFSPSIAFIIIGLLAGLASVFVLEACSRFPGNDRFQRNVEFTVLVHQVRIDIILYVFD